MLNDITKEEENFKNLVALKEKMEFEKKKNRERNRRFELEYRNENKSN